MTRPARSTTSGSAAARWSGPLSTPMTAEAPRVAPISSSIVDACGTTAPSSAWAAIDAATRLDPDGFIAVAFDDEDPARAALAAAPYLMLRTLEGRQSYAPLEDDEEPEPVRGSTLGYLPMPGAGQVSTAAAVVFH